MGRKSKKEKNLDERLEELAMSLVNGKDTYEATNLLREFRQEILNEVDVRIANHIKSIFDNHDH